MDCESNKIITFLVLIMVMVSGCCQLYEPTEEEISSWCHGACDKDNNNSQCHLKCSALHSKPNISK
jgi:hypothetical protein